MNDISINLSLQSSKIGMKELKNTHFIDVQITGAMSPMHLV